MKTLNEEQTEKLHRFLSRVGNGYMELSHDKVRGEYLYFKNKASELLWEIFPREDSDEDEKPFDDNF